VAVTLRSAPSPLDQAATKAVLRLLERLESLLPEGWGVMCWVYSREGPDLNVQAFMSHESVSETVRIVRATTARMMRAEARAGHGGDDEEDEWFVAPGLAEHGTAPSAVPVSSLSIQRLGGHDHVRIWNRGGLAGELIVDAGDGRHIASLLGLVPGR
jgi:hypothetical protein